MYWHTTVWFSNLSLLFFELFFVLIGDLLDSKKISTNRRFWSRSSMVAELVEKAKIKSTNGSLRNLSWIKFIRSYWKLLESNQNDQILKKTPKIGFVAMEATTVAMDSEPSDWSQPKFMTVFYRKTFTKLKSIKRTEVMEVYFRDSHSGTPCSSVVNYRALQMHRSIYYKN